VDKVKFIFNPLFRLVLVGNIVYNAFVVEYDTSWIILIFTLFITFTFALYHLLEAIAEIQRRHLRANILRLFCIGYGLLLMFLIGLSIYLSIDKELWSTLIWYSVIGAGFISLLYSDIITYNKIRKGLLT
jgi:hypothetical protein